MNYDTLRSYTLDITCIDQRRNDSSVFYIYLLRNKPPRFLNLQGILIINKPPILEIRRKIKRLCNMIWILISIHDYFNVNAFHWQAIIFHLIRYTDIYTFASNHPILAFPYIIFLLATNESPEFSTHYNTDNFKLQAIHPTKHSANNNPVL